MTIFAYIALGVLIVTINTAVTVAVVRSESYESIQKRLQLFVIWLLPILGAAFTWYVLREEARSSRRMGDSGNEYLWWNYPDKNEGSHSGVGHDGNHE
jgi:hypothetical protein